MPSNELLGHGDVISAWKQLQAVYEALKTETNHRWVYRGQRQYQWDLASKLERAAQRFREPLNRLPRIERFLLTEFRRHAHRYASAVPQPQDVDTVRWYALMQHHGAPTRMLDFTYSFYAALHFAIEYAQAGDHCALWAVDQGWCWDQAKRRLPEDLGETIERDFTRGKTPALQGKVLECRACAVVPDNPFLLDERLAVQQSVFLIPIDVRKPFMENLIPASVQAEARSAVRKYELCCTLELLTAALAELRRMNISRVSLFPGLDGLADSLENRIATDAAVWTEELPKGAV